MGVADAEQAGGSVVRPQHPGDQLYPLPSNARLIFSPFSLCFAFVAVASTPRRDCCCGVTRRQNNSSPQTVKPSKTNKKALVNFEYFAQKRKEMGVLLGLHKGRTNGKLPQELLYTTSGKTRAK